MVSVSNDKLVKVGHPVLYGFLAIWTFVELVLAAYLVGHYNSNGYPNTSTQNQTRFLLFAGLLGFLLSVAYAVMFRVASGSFLSSIASHVGSVALLWIFFLAGAAALTNNLGGRIDCGQADFATCTTLNALEGMSWVVFVWLSIILVLLAIIGIRSARSGNGFGGSLVQG